MAMPLSSNYSWIMEQMWKRPMFRRVQPWVTVSEVFERSLKIKSVWKLEWFIFNGLRYIANIVQSFLCRRKQEHNYLIIMSSFFFSNSEPTFLQTPTKSFPGSRVAPVVTLLLQAGIDVNISNVLGMNAFLLVSGYGNERLLKMVLQAGAKVKDAVNNFGHTPIHLSILGKQSQVDSLTERGRYSTAHYGLNRRNMKTILMDWSDRNKSTLLNGCLLDHSFEQTGQLLEDLGAKVSSMFRRTDSEDLWSEEEVMKHKIDVAAKYRKEKLINTMTHKKAGLIDSILSCGGKLGNKHGEF